MTLAKIFREEYQQIFSHLLVDVTGQLNNVFANNAGSVVDNVISDWFSPSWTCHFSVGANVMYFNILVILNGKFHFLNVSLSALHIIASFVLNILVMNDGKLCSLNVSLYCTRFCLKRVSWVRAFHPRSIPGWAGHTCRRTVAPHSSSNNYC